MLRRCFSLFCSDKRFFADSAKLEDPPAVDNEELVGDEPGNKDSSLRRALDVGDFAPGQGATRVIERSTSNRNGRLHDWKSKAEDKHFANLEYWDRLLYASFSSSFSMPAPTSSAAPTPSPPTFDVRGSTDGAPSPVGNPECSIRCTNGCPSRWYTVTGSGGFMSASTCNKGVSEFAATINVFLGFCKNLRCLSTLCAKSPALVLDATEHTHSTFPLTMSTRLAL